MVINKIFDRAKVAFIFDLLFLNFTFIDSILFAKSQRDVISILMILIKMKKKEKNSSKQLIILIYSYNLFIRLNFYFLL